MPGPRSSRLRGDQPHSDPLRNRPVLALTQGDAAGVGPEILLQIVTGDLAFEPLLVAERSALESRRRALPQAPWGRLCYFERAVTSAELAGVRRSGGIAVVDPVGGRRVVTPGRPSGADAAGALAALDVGIELTRRGTAAALVTAPINKALIAEHVAPGFRGHTDYLASAAGLERYGRDYLMTFLAPDLKVALLTTHLPLAEALAAVRRETVLEALRCLHRHLPATGRIAVAGLNPHAGEGGLLGSEEETTLRPAVAAARREGIDVHGPESPDSLFARARRGEFEWVLALYHDQGLIAVKTAAFGGATNWTLGLPFLRTSVDHGTAYAIAGRRGAGRQGADAGPLRSAVETTLGLISERRDAKMSEDNTEMTER